MAEPCSNCGKKCCNGIDCFYKEIEVDLIPQEYEWKCPKCKDTNFINDEDYIENCECRECGQEVKLVLKDMKQEPK
jgi:hypothetical protein